MNNLPPDGFADEVSGPPDGFADENPQQPENGLVRRGAEAFIKSPILPILGGVVGGIAGAPLGPGAIATAGLGGAAGESYRQLGARALGMEAPQTSMEASKGIGIEGATQAAGEGIGSFVVSPILRGAGRLLKKPAAQAFELATKMKPQDASTLFKNPSAIMPSRYTKASEGWTTAAKGIGLEVDDVSPEILSVLESGNSKQVVYGTYGKIAAGQPVSAKEAQVAKQILDMDVMPEAKSIRKNPKVRTLEKIRQVFMERLSQESPEMAAANKEYGIAATGRKFRSLFPRNKTGDPAYFRSTIFPAMAAGLGYGNDGPSKGAMYGTGALLGSSPLAIGGMIAAAGAGRSAAPLLRRLTVSGAANLAKDKLKGNENVIGESGAIKPILKPVGPIGSLTQNPNQGKQNTDGNKKPEVGQGQTLNKVIQEHKPLFTSSPSVNQQNSNLSIFKPQKNLDKELARKFLDIANGDKDLAREIARKAGYQW